MKHVKRVAKIEMVGGAARPGPELASLGINMPQFCVQFNEASQGRKGEVVPVLITTYSDKSFDFVLKTTPTAVLLKQAAKIDKGSANTKAKPAGTITAEQLTKIARYKLPDLNTQHLTAARRTIAGTARQMGIQVNSPVSDEPA